MWKHVERVLKSYKYSSVKGNMHQEYHVQRNVLKKKWDVCKEIYLLTVTDN
jgi:hypothetical protein